MKLKSLDQAVPEIYLNQIYELEWR